MDPRDFLFRGWECDFGTLEAFSYRMKQILSKGGFDEHYIPGGALETREDCSLIVLYKVQMVAVTLGQMAAIVRINTHPTIKFLVRIFGIYGVEPAGCFNKMGNRFNKKCTVKLLAFRNEN